MVRRHLLFFYVNLILVISFICLLLVVSIKNNPIKTRYPFFSNKTLNIIIPEGWAFFTKNSREIQFTLYSISDNKNLTEVKLNNSAANQLFGIKRENRIINNKIHKAINGIDLSHWKEYRGNINNAPIDSISMFSIRVSEPIVLGNYLISMKNPLPWSWYASTLSDSLYLPAKLIILNFEAEDIK